jgi:hypothetical protein
MLPRSSIVPCHDWLSPEIMSPLNLELSCEMMDTKSTPRNPLCRDCRGINHFPNACSNAHSKAASFVVPSSFLLKK